MKRRDYIDAYGNRAPDDATHFVLYRRLFLKADGGAIYVREAGHWALSMHEDGVAVLDNGECVPLPPVGSDITTLARTEDGQVVELVCGKVKATRLSRSGRYVTVRYEDGRVSNLSPLVTCRLVEGTV